MPLAAANGPQADYPVVIGDPYTIAGVAYTPEDVLNYDEVGYLAVDDAGGNGITGAHHTLPLPSYVEVTSLETGRTILVRVERRGPMTGNQLLALSPGALTQLDASAGTPVRVRRVNPPEDHRAPLRAGEAAPLRMDTPMSLVTVLKRKLPESGSTSLARTEATSAAPAVAPPQPAPAAAARPTTPSPSRAGAPPPLPPLAASERPSPSPTSFGRAFAQGAAPAAPVQSSEGAFVVQAAAFSTSDRAERAAEAIGGDVSRAGRFFRVRTGPFATRSEAEASLAKVRAAGYSDARIFTNG